MESENIPNYLYKILSIDNWKKSQGNKSVTLTIDDREFIHLSKEDQLKNISVKYWASVPEYMVLKLDTHKLPGRLVFEANPGGVNKYYHLYEGSIPLDAVVEAKLIKNQQEK